MIVLDSVLKLQSRVCPILERRSACGRGSKGCQGGEVKTTPQVFLFLLKSWKAMRSVIWWWLLFSLVPSQHHKIALLNDVLALALALLLFIETKIKSWLCSKAMLLKVLDLWSPAGGVACHAGQTGNQQQHQTKPSRCLNYAHSSFLFTRASIALRYPVDCRLNGSRATSRLAHFFSPFFCFVCAISVLFFFG